MQFKISDFNKALWNIFNKPPDRFVIIEQGVHTFLSLTDEEFIQKWHAFKLNPNLKYTGSIETWDKVITRAKQLNLVL